MSLLEHVNELVVLASYAIIGFFVVALLLEYYRRYRAKTQMLREEWEALQQIVREKGGAPESWNTFSQLLKRYAKEQPIATVTSRREFNAFVESAMSGAGNREERLRIGRLCREFRVLFGLDYAPSGQRLESTRDLHKGLSVALNISGNNTQPWVNAIVSEIDEDHFVVAAIDKQVLPRITPGAEAVMRLWHEDDARYVVKLLVESVEEKEGAWILRHTTNVERLQARAEFRIPYDMPTEVQVLPEFSPSTCLSIFDLVPLRTFHARFSNLSAGGFALIALDSIPAGSIFRLDVPLGDNVLRGLHARIISQVNLENGRIMLRASFLETSDSERELITRFVFSRQRQQRINPMEADIG